MPESWSNNKKIYNLGKPHQQTPDLDNLIKAFLDALSAQDNFVHTIIAQKFWSAFPQIMVYEFK